jgi:hypothetical protein
MSFLDFVKGADTGPQIGTSISLRNNGSTAIVRFWTWRIEVSGVALARLGMVVVYHE